MKAEDQCQVEDYHQKVATFRSKRPYRTSREAYAQMERMRRAASEKKPSKGSSPGQKDEDGYTKG